MDGDIDKVVMRDREREKMLCKTFFKHSSRKVLLLSLYHMIFMSLFLLLSFPSLPFSQIFCSLQFYIWHFLIGLSESVSEPLQQLTQAIQKVDCGPWPVLFGSK